MIQTTYYFFINLTSNVILTNEPKLFDPLVFITVRKVILLNNMSSPTILAVIEGAMDTGVEFVVAAIPSDKVNESSVTKSENISTDGTSYSTEQTPKEDAGIAALGIDGYAIAAQAFTFLVLFWVVKKYALDGIVKNLDKRHKDINRGLHLTAELDQQKAELESRVETILSSTRKDADVIIGEARTESGKIVRAAEESANRRAEEIIRSAEGKIERDIAEARLALKSEMAALITEATEAILSEKLDAGSDRKLVEKYLGEAMK